MTGRSGHGSPSILVLLSCVFLALFYGNGAAENLRPVYVIPVTGEVDPGMAAFIERALLDAPPGDDPLYVLELDTFGGRVDSALRIVDALLAVSSGRTIAFVKNKAISAGALIALACNELVMRPATTIGDVAPITYSSEGPTMMGEKFQSPLRAKFRSLARRNGYPEALAEAMVTADIEIVQVELDGRVTYLNAQQYNELTEEERQRQGTKKIVVAAGELLTMDDGEAAALGFSSMSVDSIETMLDRMGVTEYAMQRIDPSWSEKVGGFIGTIAPILLVIGLAALYTEMKAPGFGVPGILGIICLGLVFLNQYIVGMAEYTELLLIALGLVLLGFEVFVIPGFGLAGISGFILIAIGMILSFQGFVLPNPAMPWQQELLMANSIRVLGSLVIAVVGVLLLMRYLFPRLGAVVDGPYLGTTLRQSRAASTAINRVRPGDSGMTLTLLRPSGKARFNNIPLDVISAGEFIEPDRPVTVTAISGNRIIVAPEDRAARPEDRGQQV